MSAHLCPLFQLYANFIIEYKLWPNFRIELLNANGEMASLYDWPWSFNVIYFVLPLSTQPPLLGFFFFPEQNDGFNDAQSRQQRSMTKYKVIEFNFNTSAHLESCENAFIKNFQPYSFQPDIVSIFHLFISWMWQFLFSSTWIQSFLFHSIPIECNNISYFKFPFFLIEYLIIFTFFFLPILYLYRLHGEIGLYAKNKTLFTLF